MGKCKGDGQSTLEGNVHDRPCYGLSDCPRVTVSLQRRENVKVTDRACWKREKWQTLSGHLGLSPGRLLPCKDEKSKGEEKIILKGNIHDIPCQGL